MRANNSAKVAEIREMGFEILNKPRKGRGSGVGFLYNPENIKLSRNDVRKYSSFEALEAILITATETVRLCVIYRSTQKKKYEETKLAIFFDEFSDYLDCLAEAARGLGVLVEVGFSLIPVNQGV